MPLMPHVPPCKLCSQRINMFRFSLLTSAFSVSVATFTGGSFRSTDDSLGSNILRTVGGNFPHPITVTDAEEQGWTSAGNDCHPRLGVEYVPAGGISQESPLSAYYTPAGQITGLKITVYGDGGDFGTSAFEGAGALGEMVNQGYYIPVTSSEEGASWEMSITFRSVTDVCAELILPQDIGDRIVINQDTIAVSVPMTLGQAEGEDYQAASCMKGMGQHYFKDLVGGSTMTWVTGNLLPVTPMYFPPNDPNGKINAFFFSLPTCQNKVGPAWDNVPLVCGLRSDMMCQNFCNAECSTDLFTSRSPFHSPTTHRYATYHIRFSNLEEQEALECPGFKATPFQPGGIIGFSLGRTCPENTPNPHSASDVAVRGATE